MSGINNDLEHKDKWCSCKDGGDVSKCLIHGWESMDNQPSELDCLRAENERLRNDLSECIKEGHDKLDTCANEIRSLKSLMAGRDDDLKYMWAENERLREELAYTKIERDSLLALLSSGILLKKHGADERPRKSCYILIPDGEYPPRVVYWNASVPNFVYGGAVKIPFNRVWYGPIELPEVE